MDIENIDLEGFTVASEPDYAISLAPFSFEITANNPLGAVKCEARILALEIVQYGTMDDTKVAVYAEDLTLTMDPDVFAVGFLPLPKAPNHLRYCSFDEFFGMEPGDFWVYDYKSKAFVDTSAFVTDDPSSLVSAYMIAHNYNEDNYGSEWIALVADD